MKLRNFMYATMIACAFASCSKDDEITPDGPVAGTGDFTISVLTNGGKVTKANEASLPDELTINNFTVNVYSVGGTADVPTYTWVKSQSLTADFISKTESADGYSKMTIENLPLNQEYVCYGYANLGDAAPQGTGTVYGATAVVSIPDAGFIATNLPMVGTSESKVFTAADNEYTIALNRVVSRVDIVGLALNVKAGSFAASEATFKLTGISINGVTTSVNSDNTAATGTPAYWGWFAADNVWNNTVGEKAFFRNSFDNGNVVTSKSTDTEAKNITWGNPAVSASESDPVASYYILPNPSETEVKVALEGLFSYIKDGQSTAALASVYPVIVAKDGGLETSDAGAVLNNKLYRISITVAGPGSYGKGSMLVAATVSDYELKTQSVVVE